MLCVIGDLCEDVVVWPRGPVQIGSDTTALIHRRRGGSAANVAGFAAALGGSARFIGAVGLDDLGVRLVTELAATGCDVRVDYRERTGSIVVLVDGAGQRSFLTDRAAAVELGPIDVNWLSGVRWLHVPAYSLVVEPLRSSTLAAVNFARAAGVGLSVDASSAALIAEYGLDAVVEGLGPIDIVFANSDEDRVVADRWPAAWYVVKRGPAPAELRSSDGVRHVPVEQVVNPLDTTGAGDAFAAGFLTALLNGADPLGAAQAGHRVAARALLSPGATLSS